jgi:hypothetical protein
MKGVEPGTKNQKGIIRGGRRRLRRINCVPWGKIQIGWFCTATGPEVLNSFSSLLNDDEGRVVVE